MSATSSLAPTVSSGAGWTMYLGDCLAIMPTLGAVDHVIADPPYEAEAHTKARRALKDASQKRGVRNKGEVRRIDRPLEISFSAITEQERAACAALWAKIARRWVIAFCQIEAIAAWRASLTVSGLTWVRGGVWRKPDGTPQFTGDRPGQGFECLAIAHPRGKKRWNGGGKHGVWTCPLEHARGESGTNDHPTTKPLELMIQLVEDFTDSGEVVLDSHAGTATTGVACLRRDRRFIGIERDPKYFALACERLRAEERNTTVLAERAGQIPLFGAP